ncbi:MAG TPA: hypothetical protein VEK07_16740 [Polyangiaceae bacterium]|nr:hypothetical protein [Polyangiaceae bacterium]
MTRPWGGHVRRHARRVLWLFAASSACVGEPLNLGYESPSLTVASNPIVLAQDGRPTRFAVDCNLFPGETLGNIGVDTGPLAAFLTAPQFTPLNGSTLLVTLAVDTSTVPPAGSYPESVTVTATAGARPLSTAHLGVDIAVEATVQPSTNVHSGIGGRLEEFVGTSFQPANWQFQFFDGGPGGSAGPSRFVQLAPGHVLVQLMDGGAIPLVGWSNPPSPDDWDFSKLDAIVQPILASGTPDIELQIAVVPDPIASMFQSPGEPEWDLFAEYCQDLVLYYNGAGFSWGGKTFQSPAASQGPHIPWWGIYSDYNTNGLANTDYVMLYTTAVSAMQAADPTIRFSAFEFNDIFPTPVSSGNLDTDLQDALGPIFQAGAPIDAVSLHMFGTDDPTTPDATLFAEVAGNSGTTMAGDVTTAVDWVQSEMGSSAVPVWVTENNVNSNYPLSSGYSADATQLPFANDPRGTNQFFAAWRPYVFHQLGLAGNQGLMHWDFTAGRCPQGPPADTTHCASPPPDAGIDAAALDTDGQNAEVDYSTGLPYLSYWVDSELAQMFAASPGPKILEVQTTDTGVPPGIDVLATQNDDGAVVVMVVDLAPATPKDIDSPGAEREVVVDISQLLPGSSDAATTGFAGASTLLIDSSLIDSSTNLAPRGPVSVSIAPPIPGRITLSFPNGYGVQFLTLTP